MEACIASLVKGTAITVICQLLSVGRARSIISDTYKFITFYNLFNSHQISRFVF